MLSEIREESAESVSDVGERGETDVHVGSRDDEDGNVVDGFGDHVGESVTAVEPAEVSEDIEENDATVDEGHVGAFGGSAADVIDRFSPHSASTPLYCSEPFIGSEEENDQILTLIHG